MSLVLTLTLLMTAVTAWTGLDGEEPDYSVDNNINNNNNNNIEDLLDSQELETVDNNDDDDDTGNGHSDDESDADISENNEFVDPSQFVG